VRVVELLDQDVLLLLSSNLYKCSKYKGFGVFPQNPFLTEITVLGHHASKMLLNYSYLLKI
jgi:hypothetical protein